MSTRQHGSYMLRLAVCLLLAMVVLRAAAAFVVVE